MHHGGLVEYQISPSLPPPFLPVLLSFLPPSSSLLPLPPPPPPPPPPQVEGQLLQSRTEVERSSQERERERLIGSGGSERQGSLGKMVQAQGEWGEEDGGRRREREGGREGRG